MLCRAGHWLGRLFCCSPGTGPQNGRFSFVFQIELVFPHGAALKYVVRLAPRDCRWKEGSREVAVAVPVGVVVTDRPSASATMVCELSG